MVYSTSTRMAIVKTYTITKNVKNVKWHGRFENLWG